MEASKIGSSLSFGGYNWRVLDIQLLNLKENLNEQI